MAKNKKKKLRIRGLLVFVLLGAFAVAAFYSYGAYMKYNMEGKMYVSADRPSVELYDLEGKKSNDTIIRGTIVKVFPNQAIENDKLEKDKYTKILYNDTYYYISNDNITEDKNKVVTEKEIFSKITYNLKKDKDTSKLLELVNKGDKLEVVGYDKLDKNGEVNMYQVVTTNEVSGWFYRKYIEFEEEKAKEVENPEIVKIHAERKDTLGGGDGGSLDYSTYTKVSFETNKMPDNVYALYLNGGSNVIGDIDSYIAYAKETKINAFVVDIKECGAITYPAEIMKEISPTSYSKAINTYDVFKDAMKKVKDADIYLIGRIVTFKDTYYIQDNQDKSISNRQGNPLLHQSSYWPSAFNRDVWEYNIELAKEAVKDFGFNEIQFDYVRFPDGMYSYERNGTVDYKNIYNETKAQAIQRFLMYAVEELHQLNVYVSADVFGESSSGYVPAYGQYWPAISNVVDAISAMPYTDHFDRNDSSYWTNPYSTMKNWGATAKARQAETPSPAKARTWITAYNTPYWNPTVVYDGEKLKDQIVACYEQGLDGGYMTWNSGSSLSKYKSQKSAFTRDY